MSSGVAGSQPDRAVAHDVDAQRQVRGLRGDVDRALPALQRIHEIGEALPLPGQASGQHRVGNLLDALHQIHQRAAMMLLHRREADAAIAEHHRGDAMPARRRQQRVPHRLPVIVRVHVDPAGRDQEAVGVDLAPAGTLLAADRRDRSPAIATSPVKAALPVPSMMVPPRMTMSCMEAAPLCCERAMMHPRQERCNAGRRRSVISSPGRKTCLRSPRSCRRTGAAPRSACGADRRLAPQLRLRLVHQRRETVEVADVDREPHAILQAGALRLRRSTAC